MKAKENELRDLQLEHGALEQKFTKVDVSCSDVSLMCTLDGSQMLCVLLGLNVNNLYLFMCVDMLLLCTVMQLQLDRDEQHKAFTQTIQMAQCHKEEKIEMLEKRLKTLTDNVKKMQTQLDAFLSASNIDRSALYEVTIQFQVLNLPFIHEF